MDPVKIIKAIPTTWLDPILTGPDKVVGDPPYTCQDVENILRALRDRITDLLAES